VVASVIYMPIFQSNNPNLRLFISTSSPPIDSAIQLSTSPQSPTTMPQSQPTSQLASISIYPRDNQIATTTKSRQVRKQSHSCDQCRKGKRRCDAVIYKDFSPSSQTPASCTYCKRTRKQCTYKWLISQKSKRRDSGSIAFAAELSPSPDFTIKSSPSGTNNSQSDSNSALQEASPGRLDYAIGFNSPDSPELTQDMAFDNFNDIAYPWHSPLNSPPPYLLPRFHPVDHHPNPLCYEPTNGPRLEVNYSSLKLMEEELAFWHTRQAQLAAQRLQVECD